MHWRRTPITSRLLIPIALIVLIWFALGGVGEAEFLTFDDGNYVTDNSRVLSGLNWNSIRYAFTTRDTANWHPITWLSLMLDVQLWGASPRALHYTNLAIHAANVLLLYGLLAGLFPSRGRAAVAAAIWAIHPLRVESVAWVSERKDVLAVFFGLLAMQAYGAWRIGFVQNIFSSSHAIRHTPYALWHSSFLLLLSILCKPMLVTLPILLMLLDHRPLNSPSSAFRVPSSAFFSKWPLWLVAALGCLLALWSQLGGGAGADLQAVTIADRLMNAAIAPSRYLGKFFYPADLPAFYPLGDVLSPRAAAISSLFLGVLTFVIWRRKDRPALAVGWGWFLISLLPVIGLVQIGSQSIANRYTYWPSIGLLIALVYGLPYERLPAALKQFGLVVLAGVLAIGVILTRQQVDHWSSSVKLFEYTLRNTPPGNWKADLNLGLAHAQKGELAKAIEHYQRALAAQPEYSGTLEAMGVALIQSGDAVQAMEVLDRLLKLHPEDSRAISNRGVALLQLGKTSQGLAQLEKAAAMALADPNAVQELNNLAVGLAINGQSERAIGYYRKVIERRPNLVQARINLAVELDRLRRWSEMIPALREVLKLEPGHAMARAKLEEAIRRRQE